MKILNRRSTLLLNVPRALSVLILISGLSAQNAENQPRFGVPQDWTHHHIVFNRRILTEHPELARTEPRVLHQFLREMRPSSLSGAAVSTEPSNGTMDSPLKRDWNISLGGGHVTAGMSPAKFGFDPSAVPSCANDYVVFGLNVVGVTGGQGNLVAFNNLYRGTSPNGLCGTGAPSVLFSYNTSTVASGLIRTSPVLSLDGKKIAFVESGTNISVFHVLTWTAGAGTSVTRSVAPASMVSITYAPTATNSLSSPWVDYKNDVAYVGANNGNLYKITGVFNGTPTLAGAPWPVTIHAGRRLSAPVLDDPGTRNIFLGDNVGILWSVNADTPSTIKSLAVGKPTGANPQILDGPLVANGTVFAVSANDGTSAVIVEADATTLAELARGRTGRGSATGTSLNLYDGAFDNNYSTDPATGTIFVCGTGAADSTPWRYTFGFNTGTPPIMKTTASSSAQIVNSTRSRCSPISEFFNPNITTGGPTGTDFFFWGQTADCFGANTDGCVISRTNSGVNTTVDEVGGTSVIVTDNISTAAQASSIYFSDLSSPRRAVKLTQSGLQ